MLFSRRKKDQDLNEEISSHLRMAAQDSDADAARRDFGNIGLVKEVTREMWGGSFWERLWHDVRYTLRVLRKNPGYTLTAVLSLALGIGANTAIFSLIDSVILESLPVKNPQELVTIGDPSAVGSVSIGNGVNLESFSYPFYLRLCQANNVFTGIYATGRSERIALKDDAERPHARFVSNNFFSVLGVAPSQGRLFLPEDKEGVVISYDFWQRHFADGRPVAGETLNLNNRDFTILGVAPRGFSGDVVGYETDLWLPIEIQPDAHPGRDYRHEPTATWLQLMGRLKPGVTLPQAATFLNTTGRAILQELNTKAASPSPSAISKFQTGKIALQSGAAGFSRIRKTFSPMLNILMALVGLVLLICCANVANLQMARAVSRSREIGLRLAIGAGRGRLLRQFLTESAVLALAGGIGGVFAGFWISRILLQFAARQNRLLFEPQLSSTALLFTAGVSCFAALLFGLAPALLATKGDIASRLRETKTGRSRGVGYRFEKTLVSSQIVLSLTLLYASGLFIRTLENLETTNVGYHRENLLVAEFDPPASGYKSAQIPPLSVNLRSALSAVPGVTAVSFSENGLFNGTESASGATFEGFVARSSEDNQVNSDKVGPNYFSTVGIPVLAGREIGPQDVANGQLVAVVNEALARFYFHDRNPIGLHVSNQDNTRPMTIVGVVGNAKQLDVREPAARRLYTPYLQSAADDIPSLLRFEVRTAAHGGSIDAAVRRAVQQVDSGLQPPVLTWSQVLIEDGLDQERVIAKLSSFFSVLALLLAAVGLYGVMSYLTARRTTEVGVRMALGASRWSVIQMVFRESFTMAAVGLVVGIVFAFAVGKFTAASLYDVAAFDPLTIAAASAIICAAAALASWLPAHRASRVDPMVALRTD